jgi:hypothetical protein
MVYSQVLDLSVIDWFDTVGRLKFELEYKIVYYSKYD